MNLGGKTCSMAVAFVSLAVLGAASGGTVFSVPTTSDFGSLSDRLVSERERSLDDGDARGARRIERARRALPDYLDEGETVLADLLRLDHALRLMRSEWNGLDHEVKDVCANLLARYEALVERDREYLESAIDLAGDSTLRVSIENALRLIDSRIRKARDEVDLLRRSRCLVIALSGIRAVGVLLAGEVPAGVKADLHRYGRMSTSEYSASTYPESNAFNIAFSARTNLAGFSALRIVRLTVRGIGPGEYPTFSGEGAVIVDVFLDGTGESDAGVHYRQEAEGAGAVRIGVFLPTAGILCGAVDSEMALTGFSGLAPRSNDLPRVKATFCLVDFRCYSGVQ